MGYVEQLLSKGESIVVRSRQHWVALVASGLVNGFLIVVAIVLNAVFDGLPLTLTGILTLVSSVIDLIVWVAVLVGLVRFAWDALQWWAEEYIITNRRVIQTEGIINKRTTDSSLEKVNDVVLVQSFFGRILGYGNLEIVTGSDIGVNSLIRLRDPITFKTAMLDEKARLGGDHDMRPLPDEVVDADVPKLIEDLDGLRKKGLISDAEFNEKKAKLLSQL
jgi:uncharacterized membrane protein YdbT with pleckstrin-like domain